MSIPAGFLGCAALIVAVERIIAAHPITLSDDLALGYRFSARAASGEAAGRGVLVFGDSLMKLGLRPEIVRERTGRSAYNLAVTAASPTTSYYLLRRALASGARPEVIVVDFAPNLLAQPPDWGVDGWARVLSPADLVDLIRHLKDQGLASSLLTRWALPSLRSRSQLREQFLNHLRDGRDNSASSRLTQYERWRLAEGAQVTAPAPALPTEVPPVVVQLLQADKWAIQPLHAINLKRFLDLARSSGARVVWVLPPVSPPLQAFRERSGAEAGYIAFARRVQAQNPALTILDFRHAGFDNAAFSDSAHLGGEGTVAFSTLVSDELAGLLSDRSGNRLARFRLQDAPDAPASSPSGRIALDADGRARR